MVVTPQPTATQTAMSKVEKPEEVRQIEAKIAVLEGAKAKKERWLKVSIVLAAIAAGGIALFDIWSRSIGDDLDSAKTELVQAKDRQLQLSMRDKDIEIGSIKERVAAADGKVAGLEHDAAVAKGDMAKQQTRAAIAEKELLELKERIRPRRLTNKEAADFVAALQKVPNSRLKLGYTSGGGDEAFNFLKQLMPLFKEAKWQVPENTKDTSNHLDIQVIGVALLIPGPKGFDPAKPAEPRSFQLSPLQSSLLEAFKAAHIDLTFLDWYPNDDQTAELVVGSKPDPAP